MEMNNAMIEAKRIVNGELNELRMTLQNADTPDMVFPNKKDQPIINILTNESDRNYMVLRVKAVCLSEKKVVRLKVIGMGGNPPMIGEDDWIDDNETFIPGEISRVTKAVKNALDPLRPMYDFDDHQKELIADFIRAYKNMNREGISILYDNVKSQSYFFNSKNTENIEQTNVDFGSYEVMTEKMRECPVEIYTFFSDESLYASLKQISE